MIDDNIDNGIPQQQTEEIIIKAFEEETIKVEEEVISKSSKIEYDNIEDEYVSETQPLNFNQKLSNDAKAAYEKKQYQNAFDLALQADDYGTAIAILKNTDGSELYRNGTRYQRPSATIKLNGKDIDRQEMIQNLTTALSNNQKLDRRNNLFSVDRSKKKEESHSIASLLD